MDIKQIRQDIIDMKESFSEFAEKEFLHEMVGNAYSDMIERQKHLLMKLFQAQDETTFISKQQYKLGEASFLPKTTHGLVNSYAAALTDLFSSGYSTAFDLELADDFPYANNISNMTVSDVQKPYIKGKRKAWATVNDTTLQVAKFPLSTKISSLASHIRTFVEEKSQNIELNNSLYTFGDARFSGQKRPWFQQMLTESLKHNILGGESSVFDHTAAHGAYFPEWYNHTKAKYLKPINEILAGVVAISKNATEKRNDAQFTVTILPE